MPQGSRVKTPQQERSRESLERVMEAGLEVLAEDGWRDFTLARACERAGVSVGMLYRRFPGKAEFLAALQNRWFETVEQDEEEITGRVIDWPALEPTEAIRAAVEGIVEGTRRTEPLAGVIGLHGTFDESGLARMSRASQGYFAWFRDGLMHHAGAFDHPEPEHAVDICYRIVLQTAVRRGTHGAEFDTGTPLDWDTFTDELWSVCCAYLLRPER